MLRFVGPLITCSLALASTSAIAQAGATPPSASGEPATQRTEGRGAYQHPRKVLPVSSALHWNRRQERMSYRSIFLSVSLGRKVALTRSQSAPRVLRVLRNSCHAQPIGAGSVIRSM